MRVAHLLDHSFVPGLLREAKMALDCGANAGHFARWLSENSPAQIHSFEPDPRLFANLPPLPRVTFYPVAVDGESGTLDLALGEAKCSSAIYRESETQHTVQVAKTSLDDFCRSHGIDKIDFLKLDIEGAELNVLEKTSDALLRATTQVTVEFHDFLNKADVPRIARIFARLESLGFYGIRFSQFTWGDCLFINTAVVPVSFVDRVTIQVADRLLPGIVRFIGRRLRGLGGGSQSS